jgi:diguanylate cyclase (GGDEF)-like protein
VREREKIQKVPRGLKRLSPGRGGPSLAGLQRENAALRSQLREKTKQLTFFLNTAKALTSSLELSRVLDVVMDRARRLVPCERSTVWLVDEVDGLRELRPHGAHHGGHGRNRLHPIPWGSGPSGWVAQHARPLLIQDRTLPLPVGLRGWTPPRTRFLSLLALPIVNKRRTLGVLELTNRADARPFDAADRDLLMQLMGQAAIAIERSQLHHQQEELAIRDDLTKLFNFRHLDQVLDNEIRRCLRYGSVLSLIFLDLDYFKGVNDRYGHLMGSRVLVEVAELLMRNLRDVDIVSRYGGDEFVIVLPETGIRTTHTITKRLHRAFHRHEFLSAEGIKVHLTASFGLAGFPDHARNKKDLIRLADQAMYEAKYGGRDRICLARHALAATRRGQSAIVRAAPSIRKAARP